MGYKTETIQKLWTKAARYEALKLRGEQRLSRYPLATRIFLYPKFAGLRKKIKHLEWLRFAHVAMALAAVRKNKLEDRAYAKRFPNSNR